EQVVRSIQANNLSLPAGRVTQGQRELVLRTANEFRGVDDLRGLAVAGSAEGAPVRLADIADVREGLKEARTITRINGQEAVSLGVFKQSGTNTVRVADAALKEMARIQQDRTDMDVFSVFDQSTNVRTFNDDLYRSLIIGGLAAAFVVFLFFRDLRNTLITVIGLPIVIVATFGAIYLMGFTLNMVTLLALSLVVGLLIDDAIVVRENIFRHMEQGEDPRTAAKLGTAEIARAVIAVSLVIVAVFFPITLTKGLVGRFLNQFGLVVAVAVLLSLLEALTLAPMLSAFFFRRAEGKRRESPLMAAWGRAYDRAEGLYKPVLRWALGHRPLVLGIGLAAFVAALALIPIMGSELQPEIDRGFFYASMELPAGTALSETDIVARKMESAIRAQPEVKVVYTTVGGGAFASGSSGATESEKANFFVTTGIGHAFPPMNRLRKEFATWPELANARTNISPLGEESLGAGSSSLSTFGSKVVQVALHGSDMNALSRAADAVTTRLRENGHGFTEVTSSLRPGKPELRVLVDEDRASEMGLSPAVVATTLRT
ncbi:MAG: efflux RND transporter permease subunit, partial [Chloroflexota bacterium]